MPITATRHDGLRSIQIRVSAARAHHLATGLRGCRISHRLVLRIAAIADQMREQGDAVIRPLLGTCPAPAISAPLRADPRAADHPPAASRRNSTADAYRSPGSCGRSPASIRRPASCQLSRRDPTWRSVSRPSWAHRHDFGRLPHELPDRHPSAVRQAHQRVTGDALTQIRHNRFLVLALLHTAIQLRQRDDRARPTPWREPSGRGRSRRFRWRGFPCCRAPA